MRHKLRLIYNGCIVKLNGKTLHLIERESLPINGVSYPFIFLGNFRYLYVFLAVRIDDRIKHSSVCNELYTVEFSTVCLYIALGHIKDRIEVFVHNTLSKSLKHGDVLQLGDIYSRGKNSRKGRAIL